MDNRKVYSSYKDRIRRISVPYGNRNGLLSKVKNLFNGSINEEKPSGKLISSSEALPETNVANLGSPLKRKNGALEEESATANEILSSFFKEKGDRDLTDVEYEGVIALLSKSRANTPAKRPRLNGDLGNDTERSILYEKSLLPRSAAADNSQVFATPSSQKTLRNVNATMIHDQSSIISDYSPVYHTINESFGNRSISSVKRVYQFSGLPSPYRTRIRAPKSLATLKSSKSKTASENVQKVLREERSIPNSSIDTSAIQKQRSAAATTLLSILDGKQTDNDDSVNIKKADIKGFANPYTSHPSIKKTNNIETTKNRHKSTITANDINKTISYDKSQILPTFNPNVRSETSCNHTQNTEAVVVQIKKTNDFPAFRANNTTNNSVPSVLPNVKIDQRKEDKDDINLVQKTTQSSIPSFLPEPAGIEYEFPELSPVEVSLDASKVIQYEMLFNF